MRHIWFDSAVRCFVTVNVWNQLPEQSHILFLCHLSNSHFSLSASWTSSRYWALLTACNYFISCHRWLTVVVEKWMDWEKLLKKIYSDTFTLYPLIQVLQYGSNVTWLCSWPEWCCVRLVQTSSSLFILNHNPASNPL